MTATAVRIAALVPMRHYSERVPEKNFRVFNGRPLYHHIIETLQSCPQVDVVAIDTDSEWIMKDAQSIFPRVKLFQRPEHLRDGAVPMNDVLLNAVRQLDAEYYLQTHSTNPLISPATVGRAISSFLDVVPRYDSLFSVTRVQTRLWDGVARPINHNPAILLRTQDLPPVFEENSCLYIFDRSTLEQRQNRIGLRPMMLEIPAAEAVDIDEELDFVLAEFLQKRSGGVV